MPTAALQAGSDQTAPDAVTALTLDSVTPLAETVPVVWAGPDPTVTENVLQAHSVPTAN